MFYREVRHAFCEPPVGNRMFRLPIHLVWAIGILALVGLAQKAIGSDHRRASANASGRQGSEPKRGASDSVAEHSPTEIADLKRLIVQSPEKLEACQRLLDHYLTVLSGGQDKERIELVAWVIEHAPASKVAGSPSMVMRPSIDETGYRRLAGLWMKQLKLHPTDEAVFRNAVAFFADGDLAQAEALLRSHPTYRVRDPDLARGLGHAFTERAKSSSGLAQRHAALKALVFYTAMDQMLSRPDARYGALANLADSAVEAHELDKAAAYANRMIEGAHQFPGTFLAARGVHYGKITLGRISLRKNQLRLAAVHLLRSLDVDVTRFPDYFCEHGPNMCLARELLERGERGSVLEFLDLLSRKCPSLSDRVRKWYDIVRHESAVIPEVGDISLFVWP